MSRQCRIRTEMSRLDAGSYESWSYFIHTSCHSSDQNAYVIDACVICFGWYLPFWGHYRVIESLGHSCTNKRHHQSSSVMMLSCCVSYG